MTQCSGPPGARAPGGPSSSRATDACPKHRRPSSLSRRVSSVYLNVKILDVKSSANLGPRAVSPTRHIRAAVASRFPAAPAPDAVPRGGGVVATPEPETGVDLLARELDFEPTAV